jgi:hypothetical protein
MSLIENQIEEQDQQELVVKISEDDAIIQEDIPKHNCTYTLGRDSITVSEGNIFITRQFTIHSIIIEITPEEITILTDGIFSKNPEILEQRNNNYWMLLQTDSNYAALINCEDLGEEQERVIARFDKEIVDPILEGTGWESSCCEGWHLMW